MTFKTVASQVLYEGRLKGLRETVETPDGRRFVHETIEHPGAVVILPVLNDGRMVFIEQYRHSVREVVLELVAGTLEPGEDPAVCAQRELSEEIGMAAGELRSLGTLLPAPGFCNERQYLFCATNLSECKGTPDEDEIITQVVLDRAQVEEAIRTGRLSDGKSLALFCRARLLGLV
jgi:ADP-ribose pyrophosphatase